MTISELEQNAFSDYQKHTENHAMEVLMDNGEYRHIRFSANGSNIYRFDLITWPGYLTVCGDMGTYTFSRVRDMFTFFRDPSGKAVPTITPSYWAEKLQSVDKNSPAQEFSFDLFKQAIEAEMEGLNFESEEQRRELWQDIEDGVFDEDLKTSETLMVARAMEFNAGEPFGYLFSEIYEHNLRQFSFHYLWILYAIVDGIRQYDAYQAEEAARKEAESTAWTPSDALVDLDARMKINDLEEAGLVVEGKNEFLDLINKGGVLYEPLCALLREGRKHKVSLSPRTRSFFQLEPVRDAFKSVFNLTDEQAENAIKQLNWVNTDRFEDGDLPEGFNDYLVLVDVDSAIIVDDEWVIFLEECRTTLQWSFTIFPVDLLRKNNGQGKFTEPFAFYGNNTVYALSAERESDFETRDDAKDAAYNAIFERRAQSTESEEF